MSANIDRAWQLFGMNRFDLAEKELYQVLAVEPDHAVAHAMLGYVLARRGAYARADEEIVEAIRLAPDLAYAHFVHSWSLGSQARYREAKTAILEALRIYPNDAEYLDQLSWVAACMGEYPQALEAAQAGLRNKPQHAGCMNCLAMAYSGQGKHDRAIPIMMTALAVEPLNSRLHTNLGWIYVRKGKPTNAVECFADGLRLEPESAQCREAFSVGIRNLVFQARLFILFGAFMAAMGLMTFLSGHGAATRKVIDAIFFPLSVFIFMSISSTFVLQLTRIGRALLAGARWSECLLLNAGWIALTVLAIAYATLDVFPSVPDLGFLILVAAPASLALYFECRPGRNRAIFLIFLAMGVTTYFLGYSPFILFWFLVISGIRIKTANRSDPYAAIRGLVIREGLQRRAAQQLGEPGA